MLGKEERLMKSGTVVVLRRSYAQMRIPQCKRPEAGAG